MGAYFNIVFGGLMLAGGLSGKLVLFGTNSSSWLAILGAAILALGIYQLAKRRR